MKMIASLLLFVFAWTVFAQVPSAPVPVAAVAVVAPVAAIAPVVVSSGGIMGWINAHGGFQAAVLLLVGSALSLLSSIRMILFKFEGIDANGNIPAGGLSVLNQICIILGKVVDFLTGNVAH